MTNSIPSKKPKKSTTGISPKDQIHLRIKAGNKCSICRNPLVMDEPETKLKLRGEMCHIVGEKINSPRGKLENLPLDERNCYANLILLCKNHHEEIDKNENLYTIAKLHIIKSNHEQWVEETEANKPLDPDELVFSSIINALDETLQLKNWNWFIDNSARQLLHLDFTEALDDILFIQIKTVWPDKYPNLTSSIQNLLQAYVEYVKQYLKGAELRAKGDFFKPKMPIGHPGNNPNYFYECDMHSQWAMLNFDYLCKYTCMLNSFAQEVRNTLNPLFYRVRGRFIVVDSLGTHLGDWGAMMDPKLENVDKRIEAHLKEIENIKSRYNKTAI